MECKHIEAIYKPHDNGPFMEFDYGDKHAVMKVLHVCEHYLVTYECFDARATFGYCPIDHEEVQVWTSGVDVIPEERKDALKKEIREKTCVDIGNMVEVSLNGEPPNTRLLTLEWTANKQISWLQNIVH